MKPTSFTRRRLLAGATAAAALAPLRVRAQAFPSKNIRVVIPTGQGGGAERLARSFDEVWGKLLKTNFEYSFYAGAAGQVGYETFVHKRDKDAYNLLFGNMGPEMIMYALQKPNYRFPEDFQYFCRTDIDDSVVFALRKGKFQRVEDLVAEGKKRPINVAVSRLPHPASIGMLALGAALGARFNLIPYGGGNPTTVAVLNGEADCGALPMAGVIAQREQMKVLAVFNDERLPGKLGTVPTAKEQGYDIVWPIIRGFYVGPKVSDADYQFWVDAFNKATNSPEFAKLREQQGLFPFNKTGAELDAYVKERVRHYGELADSFGLIKK